MSWIELSIDTTYEAIDWVNTLLSMSNYTGDIRISKNQSTLDNSLQGKAATDWEFTIRFQLPYTEEAIAVAEELRGQLSSLHRTGLTNELQMAVVEGSLPENAPSSLSHSIGQQFVILTGEAPYQPESNKIPIRLGNTLTFGSGLHPATSASLLLLERFVAPLMNVLDLGCGSGILTVAMAKLGARVLALDNDRTSVEATQGAVYQNGVEQQVTVQQGSLGRGSELGHWMDGSEFDTVPLIEPAGAFDLIVVNILARVHIALAQDYRAALRQNSPQATVITAGYTTDYEPEVDSALATAGFEQIDCERFNEWVALAHRVIGKEKR